MSAESEVAALATEANAEEVDAVMAESELGVAASATEANVEDVDLEMESSRSMTRAEAHAELTAFYSQFNPEKLGNVERILNKYARDYSALFVNLRRKYALERDALGPQLRSSPPRDEDDALGANGSPEQTEEVVTSTTPGNEQVIPQRLPSSLQQARFRPTPPSKAASSPNARRASRAARRGQAPPVASTPGGASGMELASNDGTGDAGAAALQRSRSGNLRI